MPRRRPRPRRLARSRRPDLRRTRSIEEVILSGGDPLSLSTAKLAELTDALHGIPHLRRLRIHTRLPVVLPERVDDALLAWLAALPWPVAVVLHANHANEFDAAVDDALAAPARRRRDACSTRPCCCAASTTRSTRWPTCPNAAFAAGVLPYYLHQLDRVQGAAHFEVPDARARDLHAALAARPVGLPGPRLVREVAGDPGKRPL